MLVQHQSHLGNTHLMMTFDSKPIIVTSSHHQAMYPYNMPEEDYIILGWTENKLKFHKGGHDEELYPPKECEVVYFPKTNCLGIQSHPEWQFPPKDASDTHSIDWHQNILNHFINDTLNEYIVQKQQETEI